MALFCVTRYTGEDEGLNYEHEESDLLKKLNDRALKRKHSKQEETDKDEGSIKKRLKEKDDSKEKPKKLHKKDRKRTKLLSDKSVKGSSEAMGEDIVLENGPNTKNMTLERESEKISIMPFEETESEELVMTDQNNDKDPKEDEENEPFTVIGEVIKRKVKKVKRVLPKWLSQPSVVKADIRHNTTPLSDLPGINKHLIKKLEENGITSYFPVQAQVIPALLEGVTNGFLTGCAGYRPSDICCSAPTGSGKTLAYVLPIVQALQNRVTCQVRALVLLPVRDLAVQVYKIFQSYCEGTSLKVEAVIGTKSFKQEQQMLVKNGVRGYQSSIDIIVATPGRLVDHINYTTGFSLTGLRFLIIDEADRMIEEFTQDWLAQVERCVFSGNRTFPGPLTAANMAKTSVPLQKLLFSATLSQNPEVLQQLGLFQPKLFTSIVKEAKTQPENQNVGKQPDDTENLVETVEQVKGEFIGKYTTPAGLSEKFIQCTAAEKPLAMLYFLYHLKFRRVLCFTNSVEATHRLYWLIKIIGDLKVEEFSSKLHKSKRTKLIKQFENGKVDVLICSDAMARGMDIDGVRYVISYESPPFLKTYIHRVGRTARAGKVGTALTLLDRKEIFRFKKMTKEVGKNVKEMKLWKADLKPYVKTLEDALKQLPDILMSEKKSLKK